MAAHEAKRTEVTCAACGALRAQFVEPGNGQIAMVTTFDSAQIRSPHYVENIDRALKLTRLHMLKRAKQIRSVMGVR